MGSSVSNSIVNITLIGYGMGEAGYITVEGSKAINNAEAIFGAKRLISSIEKEKYPYYRAGDILKIIDEKKYTDVCVVFSGDTGLYSGAAGFIEDAHDIAAKKSMDIRINTIPGISSISYLSAKLGVPYSDGYIASMHGNNEDGVIERISDNISTNKTAFILTSGGEDVIRLFDILKNKGIKCTVTVGSNLSYEDEEIIEVSEDNIDMLCGKKLLTLCVVNEHPVRRRLIPYLEDDDFTRGSVPMTKALIRHEIVRRLSICEGDVIYDIGAGTGSVSIEAAILSDTVSVYSFEKNHEACELISNNALRHGRGNVTVVEGDALCNIDKYPFPDCVFIGGCGSKASDIVNILMRHPDIANATGDDVGNGRRIRIVMSAVTLETINAIRDLCNQDYVDNMQISQISNTLVNPVGSFNMLQAENPIMVASFELICKY